jgi:hypothetical protein
LDPDPSIRIHPVWDPEKNKLILSNNLGGEKPIATNLTCNREDCNDCYNCRNPQYRKKCIKRYREILYCQSILMEFRRGKQCCGSGSGIRCLFDPWIRDLE